MALPPLPPEGTPFLDIETGRMNQLWRAFFRAFAPLLESVADDIDDVDGAKAGLSQLDAFSGFHIEVEDGYVVIWLVAPYAITVTSVVTQSGAGTCTCTLSCNGVNPNGGANAVSTTLQTKTHTSNNTVPAGGSLFYTISANASCTLATVQINYTRTLAA